MLIYQSLDNSDESHYLMSHIINNVLYNFFFRNHGFFIQFELWLRIMIPEISPPQMAIGLTRS